MAERYDIFLEVQRGGWDSQKALQNANPSTRQFTRHVNAADLIKVFGAGWLGEAGTAFGKNPPFLPEGSIFKRIVAAPDDGQANFGIEDLYATYLLQNGADSYDLGRGGQLSRRQSRFIFYMVAINLLKDVMNRVQQPTDNHNVSLMVTRVLGRTDSSKALLSQAVELIDSYFTQRSEERVFEEPALRNTFNGDLNSFLKSERFGKSMEFTTKLTERLALTKRAMGRASGGDPSPRDVIAAAMGRA